MSVENLKTIIIIPGLGDDSPSSTKRIENLTNHWSDFGFNTFVHAVFWRNGEDFEPKLLKLLSLIDLLSKKGEINLVGTSAGASMVFNAFLERKDTVHKAVNVCGRLRTGNHKVRSLNNMAKTSIAFKQAVERFESRENELTKEDRKRLMTIRPFFGDELVPADTVGIEGANNRKVYLPTHILGIGYSLRFSSQIINFLSK